MNSLSNNGVADVQTQSRHSHRRSQNGSISQRRAQTENGAAPLPVAGQRGLAEEGLIAARSPPKNKNTSHVPCKFYLQGQCQAGRMCPFSHDIESTTRPTPCKYFAKGHCKFGAKCALLHITPDGMIINRRQYQPQYPPAITPYAVPPGLLSMQAQAQGLVDMRQDDSAYQQRTSLDARPIDYNVFQSSYGSPPRQDHLAISPPRPGISVLDAPLPNSFDSNGISLAARNGPFAASVPSRFGVQSLSSSVPRQAALGHSALHDLHSSAFGDGSNLDSMLIGGSSSNEDEPLTFPKRSMYSERLRASRRIVSASVGTRPPAGFGFSDDDDEEDGDTDQEESLLPASLRDLIPEGRSRRTSHANRDDDSPASFLAAQRRTLSSNVTPQESKVGSPSYGSSPSRYSGMFAQRSASSDFIGSPLRNSGFPSALSSSATQHHMEISFSSPPRQSSMSMLTQELQRTKLDQSRSPGSSRIVSTGAGGRNGLDRAISSTSIGRERIDEEQELFDMEEIGSSSRPQSSSATPLGSSIGTRLYNLQGDHGAIGSQRTK